MKEQTTAIVWHFVDLRVEANSALSQAAKEHDRVLPIYIYPFSKIKLGKASRWFLHYALENLALDYKEIGGQLTLFQGDPLTLLKGVVKEAKAQAIYWNQSYEPELYAIQEKAKRLFEKQDLPVHLFNDNHLIDPRQVLNQSNKPYAVFTPFYKTALKEVDSFSIPQKPKKIFTPKVSSKKLSSFELLSGDDFEKRLNTYWDPSREGAKKQLVRFSSKSLGQYAKGRDFLIDKSTSKLSSYLHFGILSARELWNKTSKSNSFQRQLFWREFGAYFLFHFPDTAKENWNRKFDKFKWVKDRTLFHTWAQGKTGYPIVDAGMRQLLETGWMHNRVRMIVASFLTKDLLIDWREGEKWFWEYLVDADKANNTLGWQWTAGSGPDAAPYFRVFNPTLQSQKFDAHGHYIRQYVPELIALPDKWIHCPWDAPDEVLEQANIKLGKDYPFPIVDHTEAKNKALKEFAKIK